MEMIAKTSDSRSTILAKRMYELRTQKLELETQINGLDAELDQIRTELTEVMSELGIQKFALDGIGTFYLATSIYPKISDSDRMIVWLDDNGCGNIAPRKIHVPSLKEMIETRMAEDKPVPSADLIEMTSETSVRLRMSKKGEIK